MEGGSRSVLYVALVARDVLNGMDLALRRLLVRLFGLFFGEPELEEDQSLNLEVFDARCQFFEAGLVILLHLLILQLLDESLRDINLRFGRIVVVGENSVFGVALVLVAPVIQRTILVSTSKLEAPEALVVADLSHCHLHL